jgi:uncharacterized membrane protein YbhN (UPF0104 family)
MFFNIALPAIFWLFLFVVLSCFVFYQIFPGIHIFLNQYLVRKRNNKYDIAALRFLDRLHFLYITQKVIIGEKGKLLLIISLVIWIINGFLIYLLMKLFNIPFELETIRDTISRMVLFGSRTNFDKNNDIITVIFSVFALIICKTVRRKQGE